MANNSTKNTNADNDAAAVPTFTIRELYGAGYTFNKPFLLPLLDNQEFKANQVLRILPGRRMVAFGHWENKPVVAKLFFSRGGARADSAKEMNGLRLLQKNHVPAPKLYYQDVSKDRKIHVLLFEYIHPAQNCETIWRERAHIDEAINLLQRVVVEIATQHILGIFQQDCHLKNFLVTKKHVYTLDCAQIKSQGKPLSKHESIHHLALFLAQLGIHEKEIQQKLFQDYAYTRGWMVKKEDVKQLFYSITEWNKMRWKQYQKKIFRENSKHACLKYGELFCVYDRAYDSPEFRELLKDPDLAFTHPTATFLKEGCSTTVVKVTIKNHDFVVKRNNLKSWWHFLRRCLRGTRGAKSWRYGNKLSLFEVPTAKPIAFIEKKRYGLRGKSYYINEYISDKHAGDYFALHYHDEVKVSQMVKRVSKLIWNLVTLAMTHGDLKISNILIDKNDEPLLIDFDGVQEHGSSYFLKKLWYKERQRFLENFQDQPELLAKFKDALKGE